MADLLAPLAVVVAAAFLIVARQRLISTRYPGGAIPARVDAAIGVAIIVLTAAGLLTLGRTPWCACGSIKLWTAKVASNENSQQLFDPYAFTHVTHGFLLYALTAALMRRRPTSLRLRALVALTLECGWELVENTDGVIERYRTATLALDYFGDSVLNSVGDVLACMAGFALAARLPTRLTVALAAVLEVGLALWIRDGLLLNVVMLLYPIAAVKRWQLGH